MSLDIGFIGLGRMGAAMAERLEASKVRLHVHDPDGDRTSPFVARGASLCATPRAVADRAKLVFACLPSPQVSLQVAREAAGGAAIATYIETSTVGRAAVEAIGEIVGTQGVDLVDAPVSGGPEAARSGRLSIMAAGASQALAQVRPWLDRIAGAVFVVGDSPGLGQTMKLANNLLAAVNLAAGVEALTTAVRSGVEAQVALDVLNASSGRNSATTGLLPRYVDDPGFSYGATLAAMVKDVDLALAEARTSGLATPVGRTAADLWFSAADVMGLEQDILGFVRAQERLTGVPLAGRRGRDPSSTPPPAPLPTGLRSS